MRSYIIITETKYLYIAESFKNISCQNLLDQLYYNFIAMCILVNYIRNYYM